MNRITRIFHSKSIYAQLLAGFLTVILIVSSFQLILNVVYKNNIERELIDKTHKRLNYVALGIEQQFENIITNVLISLYQKYGEQLRTRTMSAVDIERAKATILDYCNKNSFIENIIIIDLKGNIVIDCNSACNKDMYLSKILSGSDDYWDLFIKQLEEDFTFKILPVHNFTEYSSFDWVGNNTRPLIPVIYKEKTGSSFTITALVNPKSLVKIIEPDFMNDFYIYNLEGQAIFPLEILEDKNIKDIKYNLGSKEGLTRNNEGFISIKRFSFTSLVFCKYIPDETFRIYTRQTKFLLNIAIIISVLLGSIASVFIIKGFNNSVKQIVEMIGKAKNISGDKSGTINLKYIANNVRNIVEENMRYENDIDKKDSILKSVFYREKLLNVISQEKEMPYGFDGKSEIFSQYIIIIFKVCCREKFYSDIKLEYSKVIFIINELIERYLKQLFGQAISFQVENDNITSIVSAENNKNIEEKINVLVDKLNAENKYVFFTIIVSKTYDDFSQLNNVYKRINSLEKNRNLCNETQIMTEGNCEIEDSIYFTNTQREQIVNLLSNKQIDECIKHVNDILKYNADKKVSSFSIFLLCADIVNSCNDALSRLYSRIPPDFNMKNIYSMIKMYETIENYQISCENIIITYYNYICTHTPSEDDIVRNVKEYVNQHYMEDISIDMLAEKFCISRSYLSRHFRNETGECLSDYINQIRMQEASRLLKNTSLKINEIYLKVGITNNVTFNRLFKKYTGMTPNIYRRAER